MVLNLINDCMPIFKSDDGLYTILLDTGATISVFTDELDIFEDLFKCAEYSGYDVPISGFGGTGSMCPVYVIPKLNIGTSIIFNLPVAVQPNRSVRADLILSSYVFKNNPFKIKVKCHRWNIRVL